MSDRKEDKSGKDGGVKGWHKSKLTWALLLLPLVCVAGRIYFAINTISEIHFPSFLSSSLAAPAKPSLPSEAAKQQIIRVEVDPEQWSEWVRIPDGCTFKINRPGCWIEFWYWDNTKRRYEDNGLPQWIGTIRSSIFKLRGTKGVVEIIIEPKQ